jgi:hypothetical protein
VPTPRYRCSACGNLTRFDVTTTRTTRAFHHYSVGGELQVEEEQVLAESVDEVTCRWCGNGNGIEELAGPPLPPEAAPEEAAAPDAAAPDAAASSQTPAP